MADKAQVRAVILCIGIPLLLNLLPKKVDIDEDGIYCAKVKYHNPYTHKRSTYTLPVEVYEGILIKIKFTNGGWLDESHFETEYIDENGQVNFTTDKGYKYEVTLLNQGECD